MGKTEGIFLNLQCNCHIEWSIIITLTSILCRNTCTELIIMTKDNMLAEALLTSRVSIDDSQYMAARFESANAAIKNGVSLARHNIFVHVLVNNSL